MKLTIERGQKIVRDKVKFTIWIQLDVSREELQYFALYELNHLLHFGKCSAWRGANLSQATSGIGVEVDRFNHATEIVSAILVSCERLQKEWDARRSFSGAMIVEI